MPDTLFPPLLQVMEGEGSMMLGAGVDQEGSSKASMGVDMEGTEVVEEAQVWED